MGGIGEQKRNSRLTAGLQELGSNLIPMNGIMKPDYSDPHIASMSNLLMSNFIGGVDSHVVAVGTSNTTDIPLYNEALKGLPLKTILKGRAINLVEAIEAVSIGMVPDATTAVSPSVTMDLDMFLTINNPLGNDSPIVPSFAEMSVSLMDGTTQMAELKLGWFPVEARSPGSDTFKIRNVGQHVQLYGDGSNFAVFLTKFLYAGPLDLAAVSSEWHPSSSSGTRI